MVGEFMIFYWLRLVEILMTIQLFSMEQLQLQFYKSQNEGQKKNYNI